MWKEVFMVFLKLYSQHLPGENHSILQLVSESKPEPESSWVHVTTELISLVAK
jgi:hypothetical protein